MTHRHSWAEKKATDRPSWAFSHEGASTIPTDFFFGSLGKLGAWPRTNELNKAYVERRKKRTDCPRSFAGGGREGPDTSDFKRHHDCDGDR
jgi:hypothetical protein